MATVSRQVGTSPERIWEVLADGWLYANWVVGTSHMRAVASDWPAVGSRLEHASGLWPFVLRDSTEVLVSEEPTRLALVAHGGALGDAEVVVVLSRTAGGCAVEMSERPVSGPGRWLYTPLADAVTRRRNIEALARLAALAERRTPSSG